MLSPFSISILLVNTYNLMSGWICFWNLFPLQKIYSNLLYLLQLSQVCCVIYFSLIVNLWWKLWFSLQKHSWINSWDQLEAFFLKVTFVFKTKAVSKTTLCWWEDILSWKGGITVPKWMIGLLGLLKWISILMMIKQVFQVWSEYLW